MPTKSVLTSSTPRATSPSNEARDPPLLAAVGRSLRALRVRKGYSLERLASVSKVSRAMLGQIELAQSAPTITVLWRIAAALEVPFSALLGSDSSARATVMRTVDAVRLRSDSGSLVSRPLSPSGNGPRRCEFYELTLAPRALERSPAHLVGTRENLVVARGRVRLGVLGENHHLVEGDAVEFQADVEHVYENESDEEARLYLVMTYAVELL